MKRRKFIAAIAGVAISWLLAAKAQRSRPSMPLLGRIWLGRLGETTSPIYLLGKEAFSEGLRENGYVEGHNIAIEERFGIDPKSLRSAAEELVRLNVNVIYVPGTAGALAAKSVSRPSFECSST
jgi:putative tryptophan/tyrosine transport system substrate-binding protein